MGNKKKNIARSFKFLWATFFKTMGNEFHSDGQRILRLLVMLFDHLTEQRSRGGSCNLHPAVNTGPLPDQVLVDRGSWKSEHTL